ncbi:MAG: hypothetical protein WBQ73_02190 [Candidatus Babeliales bacterium]
MNNKCSLFFLFYISFLFLFAQPLFPIIQGGHFHFLLPYTSFFHEPLINPCATLQSSFLAGKGFNARGFNSCKQRVNPLQIFHCSENTVTMLKNYPFTIPSSCAINTSEYITMSGSLHHNYSLEYVMRYGLSHGFSLNLYIPVHSMSLNHFCITNSNPTNSEHSSLSQSETQDFTSKLFHLGDGLCLGNWHQTGLGDVGLLFEWHEAFPQQKEVIKRVDLHIQTGFLFPTGIEKNEDLLFSQPFGNDGALGILAGGGLDITLGRNATIGFDISLLHQSGTVKTRRVKTSQDQTDSLLLTKVCSYKNPGMSQQFTLFCSLFDRYQHMRIKIGYLFSKHNKDTLSLLTHAISNIYINTASSLHEHVLHHMLFEVDYLPKTYHFGSTELSTNCSLFAHVPFKGKRGLSSALIGASITLTF